MPADEIHSDVIRAGHRYTPFASLPDEAVVNNSVSFNAVSTTFNLAAMKNAYYYSRSRTLLARVNQFHRAELGTLGVVANIAAYRDGALADAGQPRRRVGRAGIAEEPL